MSLARRVCLPLLACLAAAPAAHAAGAPTMPLSDVHAGMDCTAYTVVRGTDVVPFGAHVVDVVTDGSGTTRVLVRVSGDAVDATGAGQGFSGSPVYCPGSDGQQRVAAALSEGLGDYGNKLVLATPIEEVLGEPVSPPSSARSDPAAFRDARPLGSALTLSGLAPPVASFFQREAARGGRVLYAAPAAPRTDFPVQALRPGASMAVGLASGPIDAAAIGTVTYADGDAVWGFGHPLDSVGARSLFLQDAYVYAVVSNPVGTPDLTTYKLAAPGHDVGTLTDDGIAAVVGRLGVLPANYPLSIEASDLDSGERQSTVVRLADERAVGLPTGVSALSVVGTAAVAQAAYAILHGSPIRESGDMCVAISVAELPAPMRFCNTYVGAGSGAGGSAALAGAAPVADFGQAASLVDVFELGSLHVTGVDVGLRMRRGLSQAFLAGGAVTGRARRGHDVRVRVRLIRVGGARLTRTLRVHVPRSLPAGAQQLVLTGTPSDEAGTAISSLAALLGDGASASDESGPRSVRALARAVAAIHRYDGVSASFRPAHTPADAAAGGQEPVYRDPQLRISGTLRLAVRVS